jgi:hypothetical protein
MAWRVDFDGKVWVDEVMAGRAGRRRRTDGVGISTAKATFRLELEALQGIEDTAATLNVTRDLYIQRLLEEERKRLDQRGVPQWWTDPVPTQLQLEVLQDAS